jgi:hypothetical protein
MAASQTSQGEHPHLHHTCCSSRPQLCVLRKVWALEVLVEYSAVMGSCMTLFSSLQTHILLLALWVDWHGRA